MSDRSKIEWTDATWNPLHARNRATGQEGWHCVKISPACAHCYAAGMNRRFGTRLDYVAGSNVETFIDEATLAKPLSWKRPRKIFVCSMTDLFGDWVTFEQIDRVFAVMACLPRHTFQVLTKRPARMHAYLTEHAAGGRHIWEAGQVVAMPHGQAKPATSWPLPNVWLGITAEDQQRAEERIPRLLRTPAAVRFLSCEPLLGPIELHDDWFAEWDHRPTYPYWQEWQRIRGIEPTGQSVLINSGVDWVIVGGESGQGARPMDPRWARELRDQCQAASVPIPFFFKQWGEWLPALQDGARGPDGDIAIVNCSDGPDRVGKHAAGRSLDGREWNEFPQREAAAC